ncbi:MAG: hypothetical protein CMP91_08515 [Gammaproteobacteria bacterium]|nr:hypothetical protein [Gammaproteobacteria bacterium]MAY03660.1 hypothetical protein [Gammaproteobacteria bacterium]|tara:strand:- start:747 stop:1283 length:537 start_codon:yes stop_codon:yes gene_type:complete
MKTRKTILTALIAGLIGSSAALASTDGSLGSTSTGQIDLDLEVLDSVEINELDDIDFGQYGGGDSGDINDGDAYCVYVNGGGDYNITPTSSNGEFKLVGDSSADEIAYTVKFAGAATGASSESAVAYNSPSATFQGSSARDCGAANNASVDVSIAESEIRAASTDTYADTLILLVSPI